MKNTRLGESEVAVPLPNTTSGNELQFLTENEIEFFIANVAYIVTFCVGFAINLTLILGILFANPNKKSHTILIAHLAFVSVCLTFGVHFNTSTTYFLLSVKPSFCRPVAYIKNVVMCAYPVNTVLVIRDRMRPFQIQENTSYWAIRIVFIWTVSLVFNAPEVFMVNSRKTAGHKNCVAVNLFGSFNVSAVYERMKFCIFYLLVALDILRMARNVRRKVTAMKLLDNVSTRTSGHKKYSLRLLNFHFITFLVYWLPAGFYSGYRKLNGRAENDLQNENVDYGKRWKPLSVYFGLVLYFYSLLVPLLSYLLFESKAELIRRRFCFCKWNEASESVVSIRRENNLEKCGFTTCQDTISCPVAEQSVDDDIPMSDLINTLSKQVNSSKPIKEPNENEDECTKSSNIYTIKVNNALKELLV